MFHLLAFGFPGHLELLVVAAVILLLFGHRLPSVMASLGQGLRVFRKSLNGEDEAADGESA